jgi:transposase-like protein
MKNGRSRYYGHRFPPEIISYAVWVYHRFCLTFRDVEDLLAERGIIVSYETIRIWCQKFGPDYARKLKRRQGRLGDMWYLDEVFISTANNSICGVRWIKTVTSSTSWFSRAVISAPRNDSFEDCCAARDKNHFVSLPTN